LRPDPGGMLVLLLFCALLLGAAAAGYYLMDNHEAWRIPTQPDQIMLNFRR
jgi:hypothetical protein